MSLGFDREVLPMSSAAMTSRDECVARDCVDPLRGFRDRFVIPEGLTYLDVNSLGPMPRAAASVLNRTIEQEWGHDLIRSWNSAGWFDMPSRLGDRVGALIGAAPGQAIVCDTTSINLYKAVHAALGLGPGPRRRRGGGGRLSHRPLYRRGRDGRGGPSDAAAADPRRCRN